MPDPDPDGLLFAKKIVFTGTLECMPRREAFQAAVDAGAAPTGSVSKRTDYLVLGATDLRSVGESGMSTKHRKALALAATDNRIQIIDEDQFVCLLAGTVTSDAAIAHSDDDASHHRPASPSAEPRPTAPRACTT